MILPEESDVTQSSLESAVTAVFKKSAKVDELKGCNKLDNWLWTLEKEFYPSDSKFVYDPEGEAKKRRKKPVEEGFDPIFYYILPLIDVSANYVEGCDDPLLLENSDMSSLESSAKALFDAYYRLFLNAKRVNLCVDKVVAKKSQKREREEEEEGVSGGAVKGGANEGANESSSSSEDHEKIMARKRHYDYFREALDSDEADNSYLHEGCDSA